LHGNGGRSGGGAMRRAGGRGAGQANVVAAEFDAFWQPFQQRVSRG
jgi:hypothetical protein